MEKAMEWATGWAEDRESVRQLATSRAHIRPYTYLWANWWRTKGPGPGPLLSNNTSRSAHVNSNYIVRSH